MPNSKFTKEPSEEKALANQVVGNIGMYYAAFQLSQMGWNVMPTARNAKGIDLLAYNSNADKFLGIQVKSLSKRPPVPLGKSLDKIMGHWWVVVTNSVSSPVCYILTPDEVRKLAHRGEKNGSVSFWLQPKAYDQVEYREAWNRIGHED
jgi:hypothetical protein